MWSAADRVAVGAPVRIGPAVANTALVVMSRWWEPLPVGAPGELWIGGAGVARGYRGRPELTAERFVPDPRAVPGAGGVVDADADWQAGEPGGRLYRTGDLARYDGQGRIEFLGRIDHQVKVRGFRIELGEVESALESHPAVERAVAVADAVGGGRLVAYLVPRQAAAPPAGTAPAAPAIVKSLVPALRAHLALTLPDYMIPTAWVGLASVPLTPNGKVDRKALPKVEEQAREAHVAPRTPVEERLVALWAEVLERGRVGIHDDFFELGGHSLTATQLMARVQAAFGVELPLRKLFEAPTVAALARSIEALRPAAGASLPLPSAMATDLLAALPAPDAPLAPEPRDQDLPLSFAQQRLWVLDQLELAGTAYNLTVSLGLRGALSVRALAAAMVGLVARHESLRTSFPKVAGQPVQRIAAVAARPGFPPLPSLPPLPPLPIADLRGLPSAARQAEMLRVTADLANRPFDLGSGPLLRTVLVALAPAEHVIGLTVHHIVADGWAMQVLVRDVVALFRAAVAGSPAELPALPVQYADFAIWQRRRLAGERLEAQLGYWRHQLGGLPPALPLATDRPRRVGRGPLATRSLRVEPAATAVLRRLALGEQATQFMVLLAAFAALLARHTGEEDLAIGTPIANRERVELERLIGFFASTLVLRIDLSGGPDFRTLLARVRETALDAFAHQDLPFERLVEELAPERDLRINPLFQVMLQLGNMPMAPIRLADLELTPMKPQRGQAMFDLVLAAGEEKGAILGAIEYDAELFAGATAERLVRHFVTLLAAAAAEPRRPLAELPLLDAAERQQLLREGSDTAVAVAWQGRTDERIARLAAAQPQRLAVTSVAQARTYGELAAGAARVAGRLRALNVARGEAVAIAMGRSVRLVEALLGVWQAGAAYVPMDPAYPVERLLFMLQDAGCRLLLADAETPPELVARAAEVVWLKDGDEQAAPAAGQVPSPAFAAFAGFAGLPAGDPHDLAYVLYTSGSTGRPKGVEVSHGALVNFLAAMARRPGLGAEDVLLAVTSLSFDIAALELYLPLLAGARIELVERDVAADGARLLERLASSGATVLQATPSSWRLLVDAGWAGTSGLRALCGGEALPERLAGELVARAAAVWNVYGPTETTVWSAVDRVAPGAPVRIGLPIANTALVVMSRWWEPVPLGAPGELWIGGAGVARGYRGRPELTAERFVPDPRAVRGGEDGGSEPGARLYRTGDLARHDGRGRLEFLGRIDHQVKVRGFRIELGEVESALESHPEVERAVAVADAVGGGRLVAYLVPRGAGEPAELAGALVPALRAHLAQTLPDYMIPTAWVGLASVPLTPNGKVDRKALPRAGAVHARRSAEFVMPRGPLEQLLAGIWVEVLQAERIGVHDNFFDLGGHSLLATLVVSRIGEALAIEVPLRRLFEAPTIALLAERLRRDSDADGDLDAAAHLVLELLALSDDEVDSLLVGQAAPAPEAAAGGAG
ncbi:MAG TPA: amino acid adenylation domain-containing protein [Thermoanaerobaculia bacterium]|nr:amino acid adenylation domain-containing protein [Thermoanaerobaculia bacterium]